VSLRRSLIDTAPFRTSPAFLRWWTGRALSGVGGQMTVVAVMFQVWRMTGSTAWTGAVGLAQAVPIVAIGLFAGALVDRGDRRRIYLLAMAGQAACSVLLAAQGFTGHVPVVGVLALVAGQSCCAAWGGPAARTFIPRLLPKEQVAAGLALNQISFQASMLAGPALGGLVLGRLGVGGCYLVDALTFGLAFYGAYGLPPTPPAGGPSRPGLRGVRDGLAFLLRERTVRGALLTDLAATVLAMPISLFPLVNAERFADDPRTLGVFLSAIAVGGVTASVFSGTFTRLPRPGLVMLCGSAGWGAALTGFGLARNAWAGLGFLTLAGAADTVAVVSRGTIVQLHTPNALLGRVVAAEQIVGTAGPDLGNLRGGLLAGATSGVTALVSGGLLCLTAVGLISATTPGLRRFTTTSTRSTRTATPVADDNPVSTVS
jgi:MFS family permease